MKKKTLVLSILFLFTITQLTFLQKSFYPKTNLLNQNNPKKSQSTEEWDIVYDGNESIDNPDPDEWLYGWQFVHPTETTPTTIEYYNKEHQANNFRINAENNNTDWTDYSPYVKDNWTHYLPNFNGSDNRYDKGFNYTYNVDTYNPIDVSNWEYWHSEVQYPTDSENYWMWNQIEEYGKDQYPNNASFDSLTITNPITINKNNYTWNPNFDEDLDEDTYFKDIVKGNSTYPIINETHIDYEIEFKNGNGGFAKYLEMTYAQMPNIVILNETYDHFLMCIPEINLMVNTEDGLEYLDEEFYSQEFNPMSPDVPDWSKLPYSNITGNNANYSYWYTQNFGENNKTYNQGQTMRLMIPNKEINSLIIKFRFSIMSYSSISTSNFINDLPETITFHPALCIDNIHFKGYNIYANKYRWRDYIEKNTQSNFQIITSSDTLIENYDCNLTHIDIGSKINIPVSNTWTSPNIWDVDFTCPDPGEYRFDFLFSNNWSEYTFSEHVESVNNLDEVDVFPKESKINFFAPDGIGLDPNIVKVYSGTSDRLLVDNFNSYNESGWQIEDKNSELSFSLQTAKFSSEKFTSFYLNNMEDFYFNNQSYERWSNSIRFDFNSDNIVTIKVQINHGLEDELTYYFNNPNYNNWTTINIDYQFFNGYNSINLSDPKIHNIRFYWNGTGQLENIYLMKDKIQTKYIGNREINQFYNYLTMYDPFSNNYQSHIPNNGVWNKSVNFGIKINEKLRKEFDEYFYRLNFRLKFNISSVPQYLGNNQKIGMNFYICEGIIGVNGNLLNVTNKYNITDKPNYPDGNDYLESDPSSSEIWNCEISIPYYEIEDFIKNNYLIIGFDWIPINIPNETPENFPQIFSNISNVVIDNKVLDYKINESSTNNSVWEADIWFESLDRFENLQYIVSEGRIPKDTEFLQMLSKITNNGSYAFKIKLITEIINQTYTEDVFYITENYSKLKYTINSDYWEKYQIIAIPLGSSESEKRENVYENKLLFDNVYFYKEVEELMKNPDKRIESNELIFYKDTKGILITDYFDNTIIRKQFEYQKIIDIILPVTTIFLKNPNNNSLTFEFERYNNIIKYTVAPNSMIEVRMFKGVYNIKYIYKDKEVVYSENVIIETTKPKSFIYEEEKELKKEEDFTWWEFINIYSLDVLIYIVENPITLIGLSLVVFSFSLLSKISKKRRELVKEYEDYTEKEILDYLYQLRRHKSYKNRFLPF